MKTGNPRTPSKVFIGRGVSCPKCGGVFEIEKDTEVTTHDNIENYGLLRTDDREILHDIICPTSGCGTIIPV